LDGNCDDSIFANGSSNSCGVMTDPATLADPWRQIIGQPSAVEQLRAGVSAPVHAYLFVGPEGVGKREAAKIFAAAILSDDFSAPDTDRTLRLAQTEQLVDLVVVEPEGRFFLISDAKRAIQAAGRPPVEKKRKVIVIDRFHVANPEVAPSLLKTLEEPPASIVLVILSQFVPKEHETIASRCVSITFSTLSADDIESWLLHNAGLGVDERLANEIAAAALGNQRRARLLAGDSGFGDRLHFWQGAPCRCGTSGSDAVALVDELSDLLEEAQKPLLAEHKRELAQLAEEAKKFEVTVGNKKAVDERHRRELRQFREEELRWGFSVLAQTYWQQLENSRNSDRELGKSSLSRKIAQQEMEGLQEICAEVAAKLRDAQDEMKRNPNETLMLQNLFRHLPYWDVGMAQAVAN